MITGRQAGHDPDRDSSLARVADLTREPLVEVELRQPLADRVRSWVSAPRLVVLALVWAGLGLGLVADEAGVPVVLAVVVAFAAALSVASYVPGPGQSWREALGSPCSALGGIVPVGCAIVFLGRPGVGSALVALALVGFALSRRFSAVDSCGARA